MKAILRLDHVLYHNETEILHVPASLLLNSEYKAATESDLNGRLLLAQSQPIIAVPHPAPAGPHQSLPLSQHPPLLTVNLHRSPPEVLARGPDVRDHDTVLTLAQVASNAYRYDESNPKWMELQTRGNRSESFGWGDYGVRGHVFKSTDGSTVIIGYKGTSTLVDFQWTYFNDRVTNNLLFSCCCGQGGSYMWTQSCSCKSLLTEDPNVCNLRCLHDSLNGPQNYYSSALAIYQNVTATYPDATIWLTGHSLGGVLSSLVSLTVGAPAVTFSSPGDALPAARLGLSVPAGYSIGKLRGNTLGSLPPSSNQPLVYHFGHTADPIFQGTCNSPGSYCSLAGYALESRCHTGNVCTYDTVEELGWAEDVYYHQVRVFISEVISKFPNPPECGPALACTDCEHWTYTDEEEPEADPNGSWWY